MFRLLFLTAYGEVAERPKATVLKTVESQGSVGSNPTLSANLCFSNGSLKIIKSVKSFNNNKISLKIEFRNFAFHWLAAEKFWGIIGGILTPPGECTPWRSPTSNAKPRNHKTNPTNSTTVKACFC